MKEYNGFIVYENFTIYNKHTRRKIKPYLGSDGYMHVARKENNKIIRCRVHTLFAKLFIENPSNLKYVNHIDSDKTNNSINNLEWCDNSTNVKHGWESGNRTHKNRTRVTVYRHGELIGTFSSIRELSDVLDLDRHKVARILKCEIKNNYNYEFYYA